MSRNHMDSATLIAADCACGGSAALDRDWKRVPKGSAGGGQFSSGGGEGEGKGKKAKRYLGKVGKKLGRAAVSAASRTAFEKLTGMPHPGMRGSRRSF